MQPQIKKKIRVERRKRGRTEAGSTGAGGRGGESGSFPKRKGKGGFDVAEEGEDPGGRCPSDLQTEPSLGLAACNPSHGQKLRGGRKRKGVSPASVNSFPVCRNHEKIKRKKRDGGEKTCHQDNSLSLEPVWILSGRG